LNRLCEYVMRTSLIRPCGFALGHLKVNCPEGAREATLGCPQRGRLWDFFHVNDRGGWKSARTRPTVFLDIRPLTHYNK